MVCVAIAKTIFIVINIAFFIVGIALVAVGAILAFVPGTVLDTIYKTAKASAAAAGYSIPASADEMKDLPLIYEIGLGIFVLGLLIFSLSMLGCCGACYTCCCKWMLIIFALVMVVLMILEIVIGVLFLIRGSVLHQNIRSQLKQRITDDYDENGEDAFSQAMNLINHYFECCGIDGGTDFGTKPHKSCEVANENKGCYTKLNDVVQANVVWPALGLETILWLQLVEVIVAVVIYKDSNKISPI